MYRDRKGMRIDINQELAENLVRVVYGVSGSGKSYQLLRFAEEDLAHSPVIMDYSGSYTEQELEKHGVRKEIKICRMVYGEDLIRLQMFYEGAKPEKIGRGIAESLWMCKGKSPDSYMQKSALESACIETVKACSGCMAASMILKVLTEAYDQAEDVSKRTAIDRLLSRFENLLSDNIVFCTPESAEQGRVLTIMDFSGLSLEQQSEHALFLLNLMWHMCVDKMAPYRSIFLDELHLLNGASGIVEQFIRQGRKYGMRLTLATQYVHEEDKQMRQMLAQADTRCYFRQGASEAKLIARTLSQEPEKAKAYEGILLNLHRGEFLFAGRYQAWRSRDMQSDSPIVLKAVNVKEVGEEG